MPRRSISPELMSLPRSCCIRSHHSPEKMGRRAKMSDQERWLNEILDILGLPRDTVYRDYTRELIERSTPVEHICRTLRSRMDSRLS